MSITTEEKKISVVLDNAGMNEIEVVADFNNETIKIVGDIPLNHSEYFVNEIKRVVDTVVWNYDNHQNLDTNL